MERCAEPERSRAWTQASLRGGDKQRRGIQPAGKLFLNFLFNMIHMQCLCTYRTVCRQMCASLLRATLPLHGAFFEGTALRRDEAPRAGYNQRARGSRLTEDLAAQSLRRRTSTRSIAQAGAFAPKAQGSLAARGHAERQVLQRHGAATPSTAEAQGSPAPSAAESREDGPGISGHIQTCLLTAPRRARRTATCAGGPVSPRGPAAAEHGSREPPTSTAGQPEQDPPASTAEEGHAGLLAALPAAATAESKHSNDGPAESGRISTAGRVPHSSPARGAEEPGHHALEDVPEPGHHRSDAPVSGRTSSCGTGVGQGSQQGHSTYRATAAECRAPPRAAQARREPQQAGHLGQLGSGARPEAGANAPEAPSLADTTDSGVQQREVERHEDKPSGEKRLTQLSGPSAGSSDAEPQTGTDPEPEPGTPATQLLAPAARTRLEAQRPRANSAGFRAAPDASCASCATSAPTPAGGAQAENNVTESVHIICNHVQADRLNIVHITPARLERTRRGLDTGIEDYPNPFEMVGTDATRNDYHDGTITTTSGRIDRHTPPNYDDNNSTELPTNTTHCALQG